MQKILILYPTEFRCQSKFDRKISKITANMQNVEVIFPLDESGLISSYFSDGSSQLIQSTNWAESGITHAVVFDDGENFTDALSKISILKIPLRIIRIKITRVVNIRKDVQYAGLKSTPEYEYIGRGSYWGNPYSMFAEGESRDEVIRKFEYDFIHEKFAKKEKSEVYKLAGKRLGCFCKPDKCHGDVLADFLNQWDDGN
jgi:hypothetical protein